MLELCGKILMLATVVAGHGRLMDPPARNAMWRFGYRNPVNYNDNELYCGGFVVHYQKNKGNCGVCGDDYREKSPRSHEAGGLYGNGIQGRHYITGQMIEVEADLTTNHKGLMKVELCANDDPIQVVKEECFSNLPLVETGEDLFVIPEISKKTEIFRWKVKLPDGVSCSHCVLRWTYYAGNTWGACENGTESVGCGNQETFINCADISVSVNTPTHAIPGFNPWLIYFKNNAILKQVSAAVANMKDNTIVQQPINDVIVDFITNHLTAEYKPLDTIANQNPIENLTNLRDAGTLLPWQVRPVAIRTQLCIPTQAHKRDENMAGWCMVNCLKFNPVCPPEYCRCVHECSAVGEFAAVVDSDVWCHQNCLKHPSYCPEEKCQCF